MHIELVIVFGKVIKESTYKHKEEKNETTKPYK